MKFSESNTITILGRKHSPEHSKITLTVYFHCEEILRVQIGKVSESLISDAKPKEFESCEDVSC